MQYHSLEEDIKPGCSDFVGVCGDCFTGKTSVVPPPKPKRYPKQPPSVYRRKSQSSDSHYMPTLRDILAKVKLSEAQISSLWARSEKDGRTDTDLPDVLTEIKSLQDDIREKVQRLSQAKVGTYSLKGIQSEDIEQVLKSFTDTEERLAEYLKMLSSQLDRFEDESKEILVELNEDKETSLNDYLPRNMRELMLSFRIFKERWEALMDTQLKDKMNNIDKILKEARKQLESIYGIQNSPSRSSWDILLQNSRSRSLDLLAKQYTNKEMDNVNHEIVPNNNNYSNHRDVANIQKKSFASMLYDSGTPRRQEAVTEVSRRLSRCSVVGDGRCLFRAVAKGRAYAIGIDNLWSEKVEKDEADKLRSRVVAELKKRKDLLTEFCVVEGNFDEYVQNIAKTYTYAGEPELLLLASILHMPIAVYVYDSQASSMDTGPFRQIQLYGRQFRGEPLHLLYSDGMHYDLLVPGDKKPGRNGRL
ncbi:hypothetical protein Gasu_40970 isoform 1 [Galdieria sulphuraria]|uniref:Ubiquitin thioesterase OTU n=1 Tax=Galdieria sulphuraria TaxID=130081 RepID=M2XEL2_GALSU|nr:hypothetical protein Gasu_40970 isoform 1 [Galdieria sulphuraria]EME28402.1 hypothetical protein isoform 1 [Galdieria sulphuraria]|eukprot:XP_005704922.1 hypothetical protein isoform 1 [Galdieria sulphuraria]